MYRFIFLSGRRQLRTNTEISESLDELDNVLEADGQQCQSSSLLVRGLDANVSMEKLASLLKDERATLGANASASDGDVRHPLGGGDESTQTLDEFGFGVREQAEAERLLFLPLTVSQVRLPLTFFWAAGLSLERP